MNEWLHLAHIVNPCYRQTDLSKVLCLRPQAIYLVLSVEEIDDALKITASFVNAHFEQIQERH